MNQKPLSTRELEIWHAFKIVGETIMSKVAADIETATGLSGAEFRVLSRLEDLGHGQLKQQELATSMGWHKSRLSHQLTRMERRHLLKRTTSGERNVLVCILPAGRKAFAAARPIHAASVRRNLLSHISEPQATMIRALFSAISQK